METKQEGLRFGIQSSGPRLWLQEMPRQYELGFLKELTFYNHEGIITASTFSTCLLLFKVNMPQTPVLI